MSVLPASVRLGTRSSALARWQADHVAALIRRLGVAVEIVEIATQGDLDQRTAFGEMNAKGIFTKEIEEALLDGRIDLAAHSAKDLPTRLSDGLALTAILERDSPLDGWLSPTGRPLLELPAGGRVATGSLRRQAQVLALRPDLEIVPIRGNVATRVEKIRAGHADATLLALAGMRRLGRDAELTAVFQPEEMTPAMGQGAVAVETRAGELMALCEKLEDPATRLAVDAERVFMAAIGGGCKTPAGVYARRDKDRWRITAMLASPDGRRLMRETRECAQPALQTTARDLAGRMLDAAPPQIRALLHPPDKTDASGESIDARGSREE
jgi:hydroxymethylbilane synthase